MAALAAGIVGASALVSLAVSGGALATSTLPTVTFVSPQHGPVSGGTLVTVTGTNLVNVTAVDFGSSPAVFVPRSNTRLQAVAPAGTGSVDIVVTTTSGTSSVVAADTFTYVTTPAIQGVAPAIGSTAGGNRVTISGSDFTGVTAVDFGSVPAKSFVVDTPNAITAVSPPGAVGTVLVSVTGTDGTTPSDPAAEFSYVLRVPVVTSVVFDVGSEAGGDLVTITGQRFLRGATVDFGSSPATSVQVKSTSTILAVSPPGTGIVEITVNTRKGASVLNPPIDEYKYATIGP